MVELHKWCVVPVAIEIGASYLFVKKVAYITRDKHVFLGHPLRQRFGNRAVIMERHALPRVIALSNLVYGVIHLRSRFPGYVVMAIFGRLRCPELQGFVDGRFGGFLSREVIIRKLKGESILERMEWVIRCRVERLMIWRRSIWL